MRTTLNIDNELLSQASQLTGINEKTALLRESLKALIERESSKRLAQLGCSEPQVGYTARRQSAEDDQ
jgi:Arc/MetJ family transcription regulator